jgi:hypothetical protein
MSNVSKPLSAYYYKTKGRYNLLSSDEQWQVVLRASNGKIVSETFDDEPEIDDLPPSEVAEVLSARIEGFLFSSARENQRATIAWFRENAELIDSDWARNRIASLRQQIDDLSRYVLDADTEAEHIAALAAAEA